MNKSIKTMIFADAIFSLALAMIGPIYGIYVEKIGGDIVDAGYTYAIYSIMLGVVTWFLAKWEDHKKHKEKMVVLGYFIRSVAVLGYLFVRTPLHLLIIQSALAVSEAFLYPLFDGIFSTHIDKGKESMEWGGWESTYHIATGIGSVAGGIISAKYGFNALFIIMFVISVASPIILFRKQRLLVIKGQG